MNILIILLLFAFCKVIITKELYAGDYCKNTNKNGEESGMCEPIKECPWAITQIRQLLRVDLCSFDGKIPIICCPANQIKSNKLKPNKIIQKTKDDKPFGALSYKKCHEIYRLNLYFAIGGVRALSQEYPHMAILGYDSENEINWGCGGSLISFEHVLTAAHCLTSRDFGDVKHVRLGDLDIKNQFDDAQPQDFKVLESIPHPEFDRTTLKNDIAIIKLDKKINMTSYVKPACLYIGHNETYFEWLTATGWGITEFAGEQSSHLMKVDLSIVNTAECKKQYLRAGSKSNIDEKTQLCAASADSSKVMDTCQGDSGGPLQIANHTGQMHFNIIGITSYGKACGISKSAGIYTRVSNYVPWIESIVWQDN